MALRVRRVKVGSPIVVPDQPTDKQRLALIFYDWYRALSDDQRRLLQDGIDVPVPITPDDDDEFIVVKGSPPPDRALRIDPWQRYQRLRGQVAAYTTSDFLCAFAFGFRDSTGHKYLFRGGFTGEDYRKVYALRVTYGNATLDEAITFLHHDYKRKRGKKLRYQTAPTISVLYAFMNDIVALLGKEKRGDEEATSEDSDAAIV